MRKTDYDVEAHRGDCPYGEYLSAHCLDEIVEAVHAMFAWEEACRTGGNPDPASIDFEIDRIVDEDGKDLTEEARRIQERMKAEGWKYYNKGTPASGENREHPRAQQRRKEKTTWKRNRRQTSTNGLRRSSSNVSKFSGQYLRRPETKTPSGASAFPSAG